ncbi:MAG: 30S ribosome-binding factor RbfA [Nevskiaceae bacterium]|jgi:ribosome-binding factor A|nr:30S ribosome-binding factor RbfA [Nevskiaceae bacterium]
MAGNRPQRVEAQIQRVLAAMLPREVKDPRVGPLTVTQVSLTADKSVARVYVVPFAQSADAHPQLLEGLRAAGGFLRGEVGRRVGLRHAPRLEFVLDDSFDKAARLESLLAEARAKDRAEDQ